MADPARKLKVTQEWLNLLKASGFVGMDESFDKFISQDMGSFNLFNKYTLDELGIEQFLGKGIKVGEFLKVYNPETAAVMLADKKIINLVDLYKDAESDILKAINKGLLKGNNLDYLKAMQQNVQAIQSELLKGTKNWCDKDLAALYYSGAFTADLQTKLLGVKTITAGFGQVHQQAVKVLAENTYSKLADVTRVIGRQADDIYRAMALVSVRGTAVGYESWQQVARHYRERLADNGVTGFQDVKGREWNMTTYSKMVARTTTMEAHLLGTANRLQENGHDLIKVSTHIKPCPKCLPWQGEVLSISGNDQTHSSLASAKGAGLFHPNCRHAYGLYLDLDAEIAKLEAELGTKESLDDQFAAAKKSAESKLVADLQKAGVIPVAPSEPPIIPKRVELEPLPAVKSAIPPVDQLTYKGSGSYLGGAGQKHIYTDAQGGNYIFKPAITKGGYTPEPFRAHVQEAASVLGRKIYAAENVLEVKAVEVGGKIGTLQKLEPEVLGDLKKLNWQTLPADDIKRIQEEHVLDWTIGNFDSHGGNFLKLKDGQILGADKEQAFRYLTDKNSWKMSYSYHPNSAYGEQEPLYNTIYRSFAKNETDLDLNAVLPALKRLEAILDDEYKELFRSYAESLKGKGPEAEGLLNAIVERKALARESYREFYTTLLKQRDPSFTGTFRFLDEVTAAELSAQPIAAKVVSKFELDQMTSKSLKTMAADQGNIKYFNYMTKEELVKVLADPDTIPDTVLAVGERIQQLKAARKVKAPKPGKTPDIFDDLDAAVKNPLGFGVKKDAKMVENQVITVRRISIDGRQGFQIYFKVPRVFHKDVGSSMKALGSRRGRIRFYRGHRDENTGVYIADSGKMKLKGEAWALAEGSNIEMTFVTSESLRAYTGYCEFIVYEEDGVKAAADIKAFLKKLNLDPVTMDPRAEDEYLHRLNLYAWQRFPKDEAKVAFETRTVAEMERFLRDRMTDPARAMAMVEKEVFPGYKTYVEEGIAQKYNSAGAVNLWAGVGTKPDRVVEMLKPGSPGLMSSIQRFQSGMFDVGGSEGADEGSGGADSAFVRLVTAGNKGKYSYGAHYKGGGYRLIYDTKALERLDWYAYNSDSFGKTYGHFSDRLSPVNHIKQVERSYSTGNEIMFRRGISNEHLREIHCDTDSERQALLKALKAAGINEYNGIEIEKLVRTRSQI
jgi:hypothetical protein